MIKHIFFLSMQFILWRSLVVLECFFCELPTSRNIKARFYSTVEIVSINDYTFKLRVVLIYNNYNMLYDFNTLYFYLNSDYLRFLKLCSQIDSAIFSVLFPPTPSFAPSVNISLSLSLPHFFLIFRTFKKLLKDYQNLYINVFILVYFKFKKTQRNYVKIN